MLFGNSGFLIQIVKWRLRFFPEFSLYLVPSGSLVAQMVKNLPAMQETPVRFLGLEDLLEKG